MVLGADGNVWFADPGNNKVGRITPTGVLTEFVVPGKGFRVPSMTRDRAGNVWLAAHGVGGESPGWVMRVTVAGAITRYAIPDAPLAVAAGSDGNIWFTQGYGSPSLGRLTPSGIYAAFQLPGADAAPTGLVAGPGQDVWLVQSAGSTASIGRVTTDGKGKLFPLGSRRPSFSPQSIAAGPDGNLWVGARGEIDQMTPTGAVTAFPLPNESEATDMVTGPDGNLWFLDGYSDAIGRITVQGVVREFPLEAGAGPHGLSPGADGRMWFADSARNTIGAIGTTQPVPTFDAPILNFSSAPAPVRVVRVQNTGDGRLSISAVKVSGVSAASFQVSDDGCTRRDLDPGGQCSVSVLLRATPGAGAIGAYLELYDNATASPQHVFLVGGLAACRLPVYESELQGSQISAGFIDVQTGNLQPDPQGTFTLDAAAGVLRSTATPVLSGIYPSSYDHSARRWVPAAQSDVSPDGSRYAYQTAIAGTPYSSVHVVDVATGLDRTLALPRQSWIIRRYAAEGIYLGMGYERLAEGLWRVNPNTSVLTKVFSTGIVTAVGNGAAWLTARNPADPHPPVDGMGGRGYDEVVRRDLNSGAMTTWLYTPGVGVGVQMVVGSDVVVEESREGVGSMLVMTAPGVASPLRPPDSADLWAFESAAATSQGLWIPSRAGHLYLWTPTAGLILVADTHANPAGPCL